MNINWRKVFVISIIVICILLINLAVYFKYMEKDKTVRKIEHITVDSVSLKENFNNIFDNSIEYQNNNTSSAMKKDFNKELVYTNYSRQSKKNGQYDININIPYININNGIIENINKEIEKIFYTKANEIQIKESKIETIYNVKYKAYVNDNILSLVISSNLKEGTNSQRLIIKTYNYNISSNELLDFNRVLNYRELNSKEVQNKITETIKESQRTSSAYQELGYNKFLRDINDDMYKLENTKVYFLGEGKALYVLYPYGNSNYTTELDLVIM